ncbi:MULTISPECIES: hypothetical protein [Vibrio]|uniref:Uncharacterized protein n=1 Tax=Vibrio celticus TaxID=446372 RepID=A0A1C3JFY6_9VIBR|nr:MULTISPECIES: hypothetical protein [Vibrio]MBE8576527.1 hypothetical protein [Vibrio sp. OPT18]SBT14083.1 hypothetical protein VCE7224_02845 [Vibrio celticus]
MQISKVATAVALSTGLLFGCNSDGLPIPTDGSTDPGVPTSALLDGYWEFSDTTVFSAAYSSSSSADLPNVYRFSADGETLYYYTDNSADTTLGEYERFETTYEETIEDETSGQVAFTLFNDDGSVSTTSVDGNYAVSNGGIAITDTNVPLSGTDHRDDTNVTDAAEEADGEPAAVTDNFDTYEVGLQIDVANTDYTALNVDGSTNIANISNAVASSGENSLFLHDNSTESKPIVSRTFVDGIAESGLLSTSVYVPSDTNKSTYLYLGTSEDASTDARFADLYFGSSKLTFRGQNGDKINLASYSRDTWVDVDMAWSPNDDDTYGVTVTIDGVEWPALLTANAIPGAPTLFAMYVGDNGSLGTSSYFDNLDSKLFEAQVEEPDPSEVTDNFDSYTVGTQIDVANPAYQTKGVDGVLNTAVISSDFAKSGSNSLRIEDGADSTTDNNKAIVGRDFANGAAETGSVSTSVYIPSDGYVKASYIFLGSNNDASSSGRFTEVVFTSSMIKFRNETGSQVDLASYSKDTWVDVTISWVDTDITVNVDGTDYTGLKAESAGGSPTAIALYTGDNGSKGTYTYFDNLDSDLF